jgi:hypothetical protein
MGVNDYSQFRAEKPLGYTGGDLPYSTKNANDFAQLLIDAFNFEAANVVVQTDAWCSRDNVLNGINDLLQKGKAGDVVCIFFSGHGARIKSTSPSSWYEAMAVYSGGFVSDADLAVLANQLDYGYVNLTFVLDTCHSGGLHPVEDAQETAYMEVGAVPPEDVVQSFVQTCQTLVPIGLCLDAAESALGQNIRSIGFVNNQCVIAEAEDSHYVELAKSTLLSACAAAELGWHVPAIQNSIFVGALKNVINQSGFQATYNDLLTSIRAEADNLMTQYIRTMSGHTQDTSVPQLYGQRARMQENFLMPWTFSIQG